ncbi:MAG: thiamine phosphate synthase [Bacteroidales bacterium]|jgi:thiamine-phosphate pyrophosphorylase|nr:thiamine phosphate synthase [Bacteroidales bacterium]
MLYREDNTLRIVVITSPDFVREETEKIHALFEAGLEILHVRKPKASKEEYIRFLNGIQPVYHGRIKIHEYFELADSLNVSGVHLNVRCPKYEGEKPLQISKSCHSLEELSAIDKYDYVFLSPIFDSISKKGYDSNFSADVLKKASEQGIINRKVIALGGINPATLPLVKKYAFGGVAVLGTIWQTENVAENFYRLKNG